MSQVEPNLALLLRDELLALTSLRYDVQRKAMIEALRDLVPAYSRLESCDPGIALLEALAACTEVMGFYNDRVLTESKFGSAQLLESVTRLAEVVGYRPRPPIAAVAYQFFIATARAEVLAGSKVSGKADPSSGNTVFETCSTITATPAFNRMVLSRLIDRYAGALRIVIQLLNDRTRSSFISAAAGADPLSPLIDQIAAQQQSYSTLPLEDFRPGTLALINGHQGLELSPVVGCRPRGLALGSALLRSYASASTLVSRATCIRHLRFWRPLDGTGDTQIPVAEASADLVVFEITDRPILHLPNPAAPELLASTLEVFVFDTANEIGEPTEWDTRYAWKEVSDFAESEAADRHCRVIVDDRLASYLVLRRRLGYRVLLDDFALSRVYVRFVPAIGRVCDARLEQPDIVQIPADLHQLPEQPQETLPTISAFDELVNLDQVTLQLDHAYYRDAMVRPKIKDVTVRNQTTWAVISEDLGLQAGEQIAIQGAGSGRTYFRTLEVGTQGRRLTWNSDAATTALDPANHDDPIDEVFDAAKTSIARLSDVARGQAYPLWDAYYAQASAPDLTGRELPQFISSGEPDQQTTSIPSARNVVWPIRQYACIPQGSTFLIVEDASHIKSGDFILIGCKLRRGFRNLPPDNKAPENKLALSQCYDDRAPWLTAEVVQVVEVQGALIRLREAVSQTFYRDLDADGRWVTDVVVVPSVASVFFGDFFHQTVVLDQSRTFIFKNLSSDPRYLDVPLTGQDGLGEGISGWVLRNTLHWDGLDAQYLLDSRLFLAVSRQVIPVQDETWSRTITIANRGLPPSYLSRLILPPSGVVVSVGEAVDAGNSECTFQLEPSKAADALHGRETVLVALEPRTELTWNRSVSSSHPPAPAPGTFELVGADGQYFLPDPVLPGLDPKLLASGGDVSFTWGANHVSSPFLWPPSSNNPFPGIVLTATVPEFNEGDLVDAMAIAKDAVFGLPGTGASSVQWIIDWKFPTHFAAANWQNVAANGCLALVSENNVETAQVAFAFSPSGYLSLRLPVVAGAAFVPLEDVDTVWAMPSNEIVQLLQNELRALWSFELTPGEIADLHGTEKVVVNQTGQEALALDAILGAQSFTVDLGTSTRDLSAELTRVAVVRGATPAGQCSVYSVTTGAGQLTKGPNSSNLVCETNASSTLRHGELLLQNQALARFFVLADPPTQPQGALTTILRYYEHSVVSTLQVVEGDDEKTTVVTVPVPDTWDNDVGSELPLKQVLVTAADSNEEQLLVASDVERETILGTDPPKSTFVFTFDGELSFAVGQVFLGLDVLVQDPAGTAEALVGWTASSAWSLTPAIVEYSAVELERSSTSTKLSLLFRLDALVSSIPNPIYEFVLDWLHTTRAPQGETVVSGNTSILTTLGIDEYKLREIGFLVQNAGLQWHPYSVVGTSIQVHADNWSLRLSAPLFQIVADGGSSDPVPFRFAYASAAVAVTDVNSCTPQRLDARFQKEILAALGLLAPQSGANGVWFFRTGDYPDGKRVSFSIADAESGLITLSVSPAEIPNLFDSSSRATYAFLAFAQFWEGLDPGESIRRHPLLYLGFATFPDATGTPVPLQQDDELSFIGSDGIAQPVTIHSVLHDGVYELSRARDAVSIRLAKLGVGVEPGKIHATVTFSVDPALDSSLLPYLLTTEELIAGSSASGSIGATLLAYDKLVTGDGAKTAFFDHEEALEALFSKPTSQLRLYVNQKDQLRSEVYTALLPQFEAANFLLSDDIATSLVALDGSLVFGNAAGPVSILICDREWTPTTSPEMACIERATGIPTHKYIQVVVVSQSVVFNSGNFIPVLGTNKNNDSDIIRNALRVWLGSGATVMAVEYDDRTVLADRLKALEKNEAVFDPVTGTLIDDHSGKGPYLYTFTKLPGGTFVLNFLLLGRDDAEITVCTEYAAPRIARQASTAPPEDDEPDTDAVATPDDKSKPVVSSPDDTSPPYNDPSPDDESTGDDLPSYNDPSPDDESSSGDPAPYDDEVEYQESRVYEFETRVKVLDPETQLVVLDGASLKADDYLYLHTAPDANATPIPIYPTRIKEAAGPIINVEPAVPFDVDAFNRYFLTGTARPQRSSALDKSYYAWLTAAALQLPVTDYEAPVVNGGSPLSTPYIDGEDNDVGSDEESGATFTDLQDNDIEIEGEVESDNPVATESLPIRDQLIVDFDNEANRALLQTLVPGDRLLIWDERWRNAWYAKRRSAPTADALDWFGFSDYQHEAVVKSVDWQTGLIVLSEPVPERFSIGFTVKSLPAATSVSGPARLQAEFNVDPELPTLRILPRHRAPYQGQCELMVLGSGDKNRKFARYVRTLTSNPGLASVPLQADTMYASNIEAISLEPRSGEWKRWVQFKNIDQAARKDRAFTLGVDLAALGSDSEAVPIAVSFGDGKHGQLLPSGTDNVYARVTSVGDFGSHIEARRPLRILAAWHGDAPFKLPPEIPAASDNLWLRIECGGHTAWSPIRRKKCRTALADTQTSDPGDADWTASISVEVNDLPWSEVSQVEAQAGYDGYFVRAVRPGVVDIFFLSRNPLQACSVGVWELPDAGLWIVDKEFYTRMAASDPSRAVGATQLTLLETDGLRPGSLVAFSQTEAGSLEVAEVATVERDTWSVTLRNGLSRMYPLETSYLRANLVQVIQGKTDTYTLGSGDGSTPDLRFAVGNASPILCASLNEDSVPQPRITVLVDDVAWTRVDDLSTCLARDHVWRLDTDANTRAYVVFGDGVHGAIPPFGTNNIAVSVCIGDGEAGNMPAGTINKVLDETLGIKGTYNLTDATGGRQGESVGQVRETLRSRQVGLERIVSAEDAPAIALGVGEVQHAQLDPTAPSGELVLVVALEQRRNLSEAIRKVLCERITPMLPVTADLQVKIVGAEQVAVYLCVSIRSGQGHAPAAVLARVQEAFRAESPGFFAAERWSIGVPLRLGDVYEALFGVPGVESAQVTWMSTERPNGTAKHTNDFVSPGVRGVIRCDSDMSGDPRQDRGYVQFSLDGGAS